MNNNYLRWIKTLSLFFLFVNPLTAAAVCESDTGTKVISKKHTHTTKYVFEGAGHNTIKTCANYNKMSNSAIKSYNENKAFQLLQPHLKEGLSDIKKLPQCKPYGQLARECVDYKVVNVFPIGSPPGCGVNWEFTACAYSPFKKGIMPKKERVERDPKKGISGKKRPEERAPRRRLERDR